jgi:hypothetical protein
MTLQDKASIVGIISTCFTMAIVLGKWLVVTPLKNFIREHTYPIQPNANGGKSLPDIAKLVIEIKTLLDGVNYQLNKVEDRLDKHIEHHIEGRLQ